jgi:hypothetical protein
MTTVAHPITGEQLPLILNGSQAARAVGESWAAIRRLCEEGELTTAPHHDLEQWRIYTIPLFKKFGLVSDTFAPPVHAGSSPGVAAHGDREGDSHRAGEGLDSTPRHGGGRA